MSIYMISYDLNIPGQNYSKVKETIESFGVWCHYLESTYLIKTTSSIYDIEDAITKHLDGSDRLIICQINKPIRGWLSEEQWKWIKENL